MGRTVGGRSGRPRPRTDDVADLILRAAAHHRSGRLADAAALYRKVIARQPEHPGANNLLGLILAEQDDHDGALACFERAAAATQRGDPAFANIHNNRARSLLALGRPSDAASAAEETLAVAPGHIAALHNLALARLRDSDLDRAAAAARRLVTADHMRAASHTLHGEILHAQDRLEAAARAFRRAIELGDRGPHAAAGLGTVLRLLGRLDEAHDHLSHALAHSPDWPELRSAVGVTLAQRGCFDDALPFVEAAATLATEDRGLAVNHAHVLLMAGHIADGWKAYDKARRSEPFGDLAGRTVLVRREQGVGDEILFATCYPDVISEAADVVIESDPRLRELIARAFGAAVVVSAHEVAAAKVDVVVNAGSLPGRYRQTLHAFPPRHAILTADPGLTATWNRRLATLGGGPRIGYSWRSRSHTAERRLEYTRLEEWAPIFSLDAQFVNLQYDDCERELANAERVFDVRVYRPELDLMNDFEDLAALIANLDLVIAPRNTVAMLAGALGATTVMMANRYDWFDLGVDIERDGYPWMPSIRPVLRRPSDSWEPVLARTADLAGELVQSQTSAIASGKTGA